MEGAVEAELVGAGVELDVEEEGSDDMIDDFVIVLVVVVQCELSSKDLKLRSLSSGQSAPGAGGERRWCHPRGPHEVGRLHPSPSSLLAQLPGSVSTLRPLERARRHCSCATSASFRLPVLGRGVERN